MIDRKKFFDGVRSGPFPNKLNQDQVDGLQVILGEAERRGLTDLRQLAYILATAYHETAHTMQPIAERGSQAYLRSKRYWPWIGRGYVQLTWKANYERYRKEVLDLFGADIIADPNNAMRKDVAAYILFDGMEKGAFTGKALRHYFGTKTTDWVNARRIINGLDRAQLIAGIAKQFYADLVASQEST